MGPDPTVNDAEIVDPVFKMRLLSPFDLIIPLFPIPPAPTRRSPFDVIPPSNTVSTPSVPTEVKPAIVVIVFCVVVCTVPVRSPLNTPAILPIPVIVGDVNVLFVNVCVAISDTNVELPPFGSISSLDANSLCGCDLIFCP